MCLVCKLELSFLVVEILLVLLNAITFVFFAVLFLCRFDLLQEIVVILKEFLSVDFTNFT